MLQRISGAALSSETPPAPPVKSSKGTSRRRCVAGVGREAGGERGDAFGEVDRSLVDHQLLECECHGTPPKLKVERRPQEVLARSAAAGTSAGLSRDLLSRLSPALPFLAEQKIGRGERMWIELFSSSASRTRISA